MGSTARSAARLYDVLLADALRRLPPGIDATDCHSRRSAPSSALRRAASRPRRRRRSRRATSWSSRRRPRCGGTGARQALSRRRRSVLAFADPVLDAAQLEADASERSATLQQGLRLGRLPHARRESRAIERHLGGVEALARSAGLGKSAEGARPSRLRHPAFCRACHRRRSPPGALGGAPRAGRRQRRRPSSGAGNRGSSISMAASSSSRRARPRPERS